VCGDDALAYRIVEELTTNYHERVTVLLSSRARGHGPRIARLPGVRVIERPELDGTAFADAGAPSARAIALMGRDDLTNFHAALRAQDVSPGLRLVMRIFNTGLGERMRNFFPDCAVLSSSSMAAPSFVAAALGEPAPSHVRLAGRTLFVARQGEADAAHLICGLATTGPPGLPRLLPPGQDAADLVLAVADGTPRNPLTRQRRRPLRAAADLPRMLFGYKLGLVFLALFGVLVAGFVVLVTAGWLLPRQRAVPDPPRHRGRGGHRPAAERAGEGRPVHAHLRRDGLPPGGDRGGGGSPAHRLSARQGAAAQRSCHRGRAGQRRHQDRRPAA
jgi:hypothetical protein